MTILEYLKKYDGFDILSESELEFTDPCSSQEAKDNIEWVLSNEPSFEALAVVVRSYYGDTIEW